MLLVTVRGDSVGMGPHTRDCLGPFQNPQEAALICPFDVLIGVICFEKRHGL